MPPLRADRPCLEYRMNLKAEQSRAHLRRLAAMLKPYKGRLALAFLGMAVTATTEPALAAMMKVLLDTGFSADPAFSLWMVPVFLIGIFLARGLSTFLTTYMMTWVSTRMLNRLRQQMFDRLLDVPLGFYNKTSVGSVINSIMFEVQQIVDMVRVVFVSLIRDTLTVIGLLSYLLWLNWRLTLITLVLIPVIAWVVRTTGKRLRRLNQTYLEINGGLTQVLEETTRAHQVIKIFGGQDYEKERFAKRTDSLRGYMMRMTSTVAATTPLTQVITACAISVIVVIALMQAAQGDATVGGFTSFVTAMLMLLNPLRHLAELNGPLQRGLAASDMVFALIDAQAERVGGRTLPQRAAGKLEFDNVSFTYPEQNVTALNDINLKVMPGETVAFVGMSGSGKSTLVNLVPNFYTASSGRILLDDLPIDEIELSSLRAQMAMVSQNVVLFDDTVAANIAYGDPAPDMARIKAAAEAAYLGEVIADLPQGLQTPIGDNGSRLSGGQRQRLAIARAIYKDAPILILDEATSALDSESERAVQAALETLMKGRTTLVIAHRLSTIERADRIVVLSSGRIVETGTHVELLGKNGVYAHLHQLQFANA